MLSSYLLHLSPSNDGREVDGQAWQLRELIKEHRRTTLYEAASVGPRRLLAVMPDLSLIPFTCIKNSGFLAFLSARLNREVAHRFPNAFMDDHNLLAPFRCHAPFCRISTDTDAHAVVDQCGVVSIKPGRTASRKGTAVAAQVDLHGHHAVTQHCFTQRHHGIVDAVGKALRDLLSCHV